MNEEVNLPSPIPTLLSPQLNLLSAQKLAREREYDALTGIRLMVASKLHFQMDN